MDFVIEMNLPSVLLNEVEAAAKRLEMSPNLYLQEALHEKIACWLRNQNNGAVSSNLSKTVSSRAMLPDELLGQVERAAVSFGLSVDEFLLQALQEKVNRLPQDAAHKEEMARIVEHLFEKNGELYRRLAQWPTAEGVSQ